MRIQTKTGVTDRIIRIKKRLIISYSDELISRFFVS
jgi:hypothetical protein